MSYHNVFVLFWEQVKENIEAGSLAKVTMAKTIGKQELKNIFVRPIYADNGVKVLLKFSYRPREVEDVEKELSLEAAFEILQSHLKNPFLSVLMFTITKDVLFKINKKGAGSITETPPTFTNVTHAD